MPIVNRVRAECSLSLGANPCRASQSRSSIVLLGAGQDQDIGAIQVFGASLPHMANFTDFDALAAEPSVALAFLEYGAGKYHSDVLSAQSDFGEP